MEASKGTDVGSLVKSLPEISGKVLVSEPMSRHASFRIGGPADIFAVPNDVSELQALLRWARERLVPVFVLGAGTNLLVADRGIRGLVVRLGPAFARTEVRGCMVKVGAAARLSRLVRQSLGHGLAGLEGLAGIPGTVGGAVCMNAGTPSGCVEDMLKNVLVLDAGLELRRLPRSRLGLKYRGSRIRERGLVIVEAAFRLQAKEPWEINDIVASLLSKRRRTQPVGIGTAGSVFKNPPGGYAGQILEAVGAKGMQVGGARVSRKHANFIENTGSASAEDVRQLVVRLQELVADKAGVALEPEIEFVGEW